MVLIAGVGVGLQLVSRCAISNFRLFARRLLRLLSRVTAGDEGDAFEDFGLRDAFLDFRVVVGASPLRFPGLAAGSVVGSSNFFDADGGVW